MEIRIDSQEELPRVAEAIVDRLAERRTVAFHGAMGAGKTTLIRAIMRVMGSLDEVSSPTFAIVNEYAAGDGRRVCHFDLYRVESLAEVLAVGMDEYLDSDAVCLIEWPENAAAILPPDALHVAISAPDDAPESGMRVFVIEENY